MTFITPPGVAGADGAGGTGEGPGAGAGSEPDLHDQRWSWVRYFSSPAQQDTSEPVDHTSPPSPVHASAGSVSGPHHFAPFVPPSLHSFSQFDWLSLHHQLPQSMPLFQLHPTQFLMPMPVLVATFAFNEGGPPASRMHRLPRPCWVPRFDLPAPSSPGTRRGTPALRSWRSLFEGVSRKGSVCKTGRKNTRGRRQS